MAKFDKSMEYISQTQTLIGQQRKRLVDQDTGEVIEVDQITKRALGQKQFWKIYLMDFLQVLGGFEYKQLDVLIYILEHTEAANNTFIGTYRSLEKNVGVSYDTVRRTITLAGQGLFEKSVERCLSSQPNDYDERLGTQEKSVAELLQRQRARAATGRANVYRRTVKA